MGKIHEQTRHRRGYRDERKLKKRRSTLLVTWRTHSKNNEVSLNTYQNGYNKRVRAPNAGKDAEKVDDSRIAAENAEAALGNSLVVSLNIKRVATVQPATAPLSVHPSQMETYLYTRTCTQMFIVVYS